MRIPRASWLASLVVLWAGLASARTPSLALAPPQVGGCAVPAQGPVVAGGVGTVEYCPGGNWADFGGPSMWASWPATIAIDDTSFPVFGLSCATTCRGQIVADAMAKAAAPGSHKLTVSVTRNGVSTGPSDPTWIGDPPPVPPDCSTAVIFDLGEWTRTIPVKGRARVSFSLLRSAQPVTGLRWLLDGVVVPGRSLDGTDLRDVGAAYFPALATPGRYVLSVVATAGDCTAGATRLATIEVVP